MILNSQEYVKLRDKYIRFLEEYKILRNEYWALKTEVNNPDSNSSSLFSITASEVEADLSLLRGGGVGSSWGLFNIWCTYWFILNFIDW